MKITGSDHEINFWKGFVKTERFLTGWCGPEKTPELNDIVYEFIKKNLPEGGKVLDCGSGVCSILNGTVPNDNLIVTDLLAAEYAKIFDYRKHDIVQPIPIGCEDLPYVNQFDIVHISNALDHTQNPVVAFEFLKRAVKPGGYLIVQGFENEGEYENWQGFHQWNLSLTEQGQIRIASKSGEISYTECTKDFHRVYVELLGREWFIWIGQI